MYDTTDIVSRAAQSPISFFLAAGYALKRGIFSTIVAQPVFTFVMKLLPGMPDIAATLSTSANLAATVIAVKVGLSWLTGGASDMVVGRMLGGSCPKGKSYKQHKPSRARTGY